MAAMKAKTEVLMSELRISGVEPTQGPSISVTKGALAPGNLGATIFANPQHGSAYDPMAFSPRPQPVNSRSTWAPVKGISPRATALPYPFPIYTSGNMATTTTDPLVPHTVLQDPMMSRLNLIIILHLLHLALCFNLLHLSITVNF